MDYTDKQIISKIKQAKKKLDGKQCRENFGEKEQRAIKDMFCMYSCSKEVELAYREFNDWCNSYEGVF